MATCYETISVSTFTDILASCKGLRVSRVWRSVDFCIFLEVGRLTKSGKYKKLKGQITFMLETDWRVEKARSIQVGSNFSDKRINNQLATLVGTTIDSVEIVGKLPELYITFGDGRRLATFTCWIGQPHWHIGFNDSSLFPLHLLWKGIDVSPWIRVQRGRLEVEYCYDDSKASVRKAVEKMGFRLN